MDIVWGCISTVTLCVWTSLSTTLDIETNLKQKIHTCVGRVLAPELSVRSALSQRARASALRRTLRKVAGWEAWSQKQSFNLVNEAVTIETTALEPLDITVPDSESLETTTLDKKVLVLEPKLLVEYALSGELEFTDMPADTSIDDRSKVDWTAKAISFIQVVWFLATIVSRLVSHYPISFLEDITITYVVYGAVIYTITWSYPQGIRERWHVTLRGKEDTETSDAIAPSSPPTDSAAVMVSVSWGWWLILQLGVFARVYVAAWYFPFPSLAEAWLWRSASLILAVGFVLLLCLVFTRGDELDVHGNLRWVVLVPVVVCSVARVVLLTLAFTALRKGSPGLYAKPAWSSYWAHIGN